MSLISARVISETASVLNADCAERKEQKKDVSAASFTERSNGIIGMVEFNATGVDVEGKYARQRTQNTTANTAVD